jgi:hypothetical protein
MGLMLESHSFRLSLTRDSPALWVAVKALILVRASRLSTKK